MVYFMVIKLHLISQSIYTKVRLQMKHTKTYNLAYTKGCGTLFRKTFIIGKDTNHP